MWPDNETTEDLLGFQVHADLIRSIVTDPEMLPVTIGVFGDWGSGKTSVMKMLEESFNPNNYDEGSEERTKYERIACLYFNGWLFEGYDDAKSAILSSILLQLSEHQCFGPKIRDKAANLLKSVDSMRFVRLGLQHVALPAFAAYVSGGASLIPSIVGGASSVFGKKEEVSEEDNSEETAADENVDLDKLINANKPSSAHLDVRSFRDKFSSLIAECDIDSLVVLIDDLDRCSPDRIIDNLEAIKLFLNVEQTAFIIGADRRIVRHAIAMRYKPREIEEQDDQEEPADRLVTDYLEKLIQIPYHLPQLSPTEVETYMVLLFCLRDLKKEDAEKCLDAFDSLRTRDRYSVFGYTNVKNVLGEQGVPESLSKSLTFSAASAPLITEGLKGNPRQIKRFLNAFVLRKKLAEVAKLLHIRDEVLVKLMVLEYVHQRQYGQLYEWQAEDDGFPKKIKELELTISSRRKINDKGNDEKELEKKENALEIDEGWKTLSMQRWVEMEPLLSEVDLRDYFWISRDQLQSTFSGISMVSPIVRRILEDLISDNQGKVKTAVKGAVDLHVDEKISLLTQLEEHVHRHPKQTQGYDVLRMLIEGNIEGSIETLVRVLEKCSPRSIPPSVAFILTTLAGAKSEWKDILQPTINHLAETNSRIGKALKIKKRNLER